MFYPGMCFSGDVVQEGRIFETSDYNYKYIVQGYSYSWICFMHYSSYLRTSEKLHNSVSSWLHHSTNETRVTTWMQGLKMWIKHTADSLELCVGRLRVSWHEAKLLDLFVILGLAFFFIPFAWSLPLWM